jgi:hypothetical protein
MGMVYAHNAGLNQKKMYPRKFVSEQNLAKPRNILGYTVYQKVRVVAYSSQKVHRCAYTIVY